ncbi:hypothetical protein BH23GEM11_BH23GEM11_18120 [soil metagenome]
MTSQQHSGTERDTGTGPRAHTGPDARKWALGAIFASAVAIVLAYLSAFLPGGSPTWAAWLFMTGMSVMMVATMALGASRNGSIGKLWIPFALVLVILLAGFGAVLAMPPADPADPTLWLGLPPRAAIVLFGIGFLPLLLVPVSYAWTFSELTLAPGDLDRVRDEALRARGETPPGETPPGSHPSAPGDAP